MGLLPIKPAGVLFRRPRQAQVELTIIPSESLAQDMVAAAEIFCIEFRYVGLSRQILTP